MSLSSMGDDLTDLALDEEALHEQGDFSVHLCNWPHPIHEDQRGYALVNNRTKCVEGLYGVEAQAIRELTNSVSDLEAALRGQKANVEKDFDALVRRMQEKSVN